MDGPRTPARRGRTASLFLSFVSLCSQLGIGLTTAGGAAAGPFVDPGYADSAMAAWATHVDEIVRGPMSLVTPGLGMASAGAPAVALGVATGSPTDVVSLGDGGWMTLYFDSGIANGPADDFAVFENGFFDLEGFFGELAFVEVSSDGVAFARFDSETLNGARIDGFEYLDPTDYFGLAGRHPALLGTGFDLADLAGDPLVQDGTIDLGDVRYVRVVDVVGNGTTFDRFGAPIYDPFETPFPTGGFDLDAIGVIHLPEPSLAGGLWLGFAALTLRRRARRAGRGSSAAAILVALPILGMAGPASALTATFDDLGLGAESFLDGSTLAGGYSSGGIFFENDYDPTFGSFSGFAASTRTDSTTPGFGNQFSNITGGGAGGSSAFGLAFGSGRIVLPTEKVVLGAEFTNTTYAALSMRDGDAFSKKFGGPTGDDPDFFRLKIEGLDSSLASTGTLDVMLADYRFADNGQDFILDQWLFVDLRDLGAVKELAFSFESSDVGTFGINTPLYFAIDNLVTIPEPGSAALLALGLAGLASRRAPRSASRR